MSQFDENDHSLEAQLGTDQETLFRILARRNRLLGVLVAVVAAAVALLASR